MRPTYIDFQGIVERSIEIYACCAVDDDVTSFNKLVLVLFGES